MTVDYSRFDAIDTDSDDDGDASMQQGAASSPRGVPPSLPSRPPDNVMEDLEDYFERLDARRADTEAGSVAAAAAASVARFAEPDFACLEQSRGPGRRSSNAGECAICLAILAESEECVVLPCAAGHRFHSECARSWLSRNVTCPLCRVDVRAVIHRATAFGSPTATAGDAMGEEGGGGGGGGVSNSIDGASPSRRSFGFTRDGGVIARYMPRPPPELPRPSYIPADLRGIAELVEIEYPERGTARVWRLPRQDGRG